jgi:hypothetical protein
MTMATSRPDLNISATTAELLELVDVQDDGDVIAQGLEAALLALVDITGDDPNRPMVSRPGKVARRAIARIREILESESQ